jgi:hypothetical protein
MENQMNKHRLDQPSGVGLVHYLRPQHSDPSAIVEDPHMSLQDKRVTLADWASDARAVRDHPALRQLDTGVVLDIDAILGALKLLGGIQEQHNGFNVGSPDSNHLRRSPNGERLSAWKFWEDDDDDPPPCPAAAVPWRPRPILDATGLMVA